MTNLIARHLRHYVGNRNNMLDSSVYQLMSDAAHELDRREERIRDLEEKLSNFEYDMREGLN